jgi:hypothetical protein
VNVIDEITEYLAVEEGRQRFREAMARTDRYRDLIEAAYPLIRNRDDLCRFAELVRGTLKS